MSKGKSKEMKRQKIEMVTRKLQKKKKGKRM